jgi:membrane-associated phospholipid phosphatase
VKNYTFVDYATQAYILLVGLLIVSFHNDTVPSWPWLLGGNAAWLVLVHLIVQAYARYPSLGLLDFLRHFYPVLLYTGLYVETGLLSRMFFRDYLDPTLIQWEQHLWGCQPSVVFMQKLPWLLVSEVFYASYFSYYVIILAMGVVLFLRSRRQFFHYVSVISFVFYVCYLMYIILPVAGTPAFFHDAGGYDLPAATQRLAVTDGYPESVRNGVFFRLMHWLYEVFEPPGAAFPSSHVVVALCTVYFSFRYLRPIRFAHLGLAILLCISTVYCRYHYVVDALAGVITAAVLLPIGNWLYFKYEARDVGQSERTLAGESTCGPVASGRLR